MDGWMDGWDTTTGSRFVCKDGGIAAMWNGATDRVGEIGRRCLEQCEQDYLLVVSSSCLLSASFVQASAQYHHESNQPNENKGGDKRFRSHW